MVSTSQIKFLSQHVDALRVSFSLAERENEYFANLVSFLDEKKLEAQALDGEGNNRFVIADVMGSGLFKVYSGGVRTHRLRLENENLTLLVSDSKNETVPNFVVEFRASYLYAVGYEAAFYAIERVLKRWVDYFALHNKVHQIDLATDLMGIRFTYLDKLRFRCVLKGTEYNKTKADFKGSPKYEEVSDDMDTRVYTRAAKLTGFSFGSTNGFMFRIYDKTAEISLRQKNQYIRSRWAINGYDIAKKEKVWRFEVQYGREQIKQYINVNECTDEYRALRGMLSGLWFNALDKVRFVNLTDEEAQRVDTLEKSDSVKKVFQRAEKREAPCHFWNMLQTSWCNDRASAVGKMRDINECKIKTIHKTIKTFVGQALKYSQGDPQYIPLLIKQVNDTLQMEKGISLYEYGCNKVLSDFVRDDKYVRMYGISTPIRYQNSAIEVGKKIAENFCGLESIAHTKEYRDFLERRAYFENKILEVA